MSQAILDRMPDDAIHSDPPNSTRDAGQPDAKTNARTAKTRAKWAVAALAIAAAAGLYLTFGDSLTLQNLAKHEQTLREYQTASPWIVYAAAFLIYVAVTGLSLPGAAILTLFYGWYFGLWRGVLLVSFASTAGATVAFLLSRYLLRDAVQGRFGSRLESFNEALRREGGFYLFSLRLIPAVPFFVINAVMGLTPMRTRTFWWVSQLGMLPGTVAYVYAGSTFPSLDELAAHGASGILSWPLVLAFVGLAILPMATRALVRLLRPKVIPDLDQRAST